MIDLTSKKLGKLVGLKKETFNQLVAKKEIQLQKGRLIPVYKLGDEIALTSVLLTSLKLIKEFKNTILSEAKMQIGGSIYVYSEVVFSEFPNDRIDGLILIVKAGEIRDAAILEVKNGKNELDKEQLERYQKIAKRHSIPKFITISNQFVSDSSQSPANVKNISGVEFRHFSWTYILTIGHILLSNKGTTVQDEDQKEIMREVLKYLEFDKSGVLGLNQMKAGWVKISDKITQGTNIKTTDDDVYEAALSWQQEERDMALQLSRKLGILVSTGSTKFKGKLNEQLASNCKDLVSNQRLISNLKIKGAVSDIKIEADFNKRTVEFSVFLNAPEEKTTKGQIGWIKRQLDVCIKKNEPLLSKIISEILLEITIKKSPLTERLAIDKIDNAIPNIKGKEIRGFKILFLRDFGKKFSSPRKIVEIMEDMLITYYTGIVQHLTKWEPTAPKIKNTQPRASEDDDIQDDIDNESIFNTNDLEADTSSNFQIDQLSEN